MYCFSYPLEYEKEIPPGIQEFVLPDPSSPLCPSRYVIFLLPRKSPFFLRVRDPSKQFFFTTQLQGTRPTTMFTNDQGGARIELQAKWDNVWVIVGFMGYWRFLDS